MLPSGEGRLFLEEDESPASLVTVATLRFTPAAEDDGARAACTARNRYFPADEKEDGYRISVTCEDDRVFVTFFHCNICHLLTNPRPGPITQ